MSETSAASLDVAFRLIDSLTTIKDVLGALISDDSGDIIAQDFMSPELQQLADPIARQTLPAIAKAVGDIGHEGTKFGAVNDMVFQLSELLVRVSRRDQLFLLVLAKGDTNLGMLNVDLKQRQDMMKELAGDTIVSERDKEREHLFEVLRKDGTADNIIAERQDLGSLRALHGMMFQTALDIGINRDVLTGRLNDINYRIYRDSLLDIGFDFFNRKTLDNYDPALARRVVAAQINGMADLIKSEMP